MAEPEAGGSASGRKWPLRIQLLPQARRQQDEVGSRLLVAETILAVERLRRGPAPVPAPPLAAAFATDFVRERVEALLGADAGRTVPVGPLLAAAALVVAIASAGWVHQFTEFLIAVLAG